MAALNFRSSRESVRLRGDRSSRLAGERCHVASMSCTGLELLQIIIYQLSTRGQDTLSRKMVVTHAPIAANCVEYLYGFAQFLIGGLAALTVQLSQHLNGSIDTTII